MVSTGSKEAPWRRGNGSWVRSFDTILESKSTILTFAVITGVITVLFGIAVWFFFPDNPLNAKFLTPEERAQAILRIKENHSGIEQKRFKKYQSV